jgi:hypothetical protein
MNFSSSVSTLARKVSAARLSRVITIHKHSFSNTEFLVTGYPLPPGIFLGRSLKADSTQEQAKSQRFSLEIISGKRSL